MTVPSLARAGSAARASGTRAVRGRTPATPVLLVGGCLAAAVAALLVAQGGAVPAATVDADLARLLRAMAVIKVATQSAI